MSTNGGKGRRRSVSVQAAIDKVTQLTEEVRRRNHRHQETPR
jgi:hypothetical protein